jgi:PilZ domain
MIERRQNARCRVIYGGVVGYNQRQSMVECVIRNFSTAGASVEFDDPAVLPDVVDLLVARKDRAFTATVAWRQFNKAGLAFKSVKEDAAMPLDWILRLRANRSEHRELRNRLAALAPKH